MYEFFYECSTKCCVSIYDENVDYKHFATVLNDVNKVLLLVSDGVNNTFLKSIKNALSNYGVQLYTEVVADGETLKNVQNALYVTDILQQNLFGRNDLIINVGGGTVCDLGAFVASIYKRGINYLNVPTTLLCSVDAAIGGKSAVDANGEKNVLGTFKQPLKVFIYTQVLNELHNELLSDGLSEIVKYGVIDKNFAINLKMHDNLNAIKRNLSNIIADCLQIKAKYVQLDEYDVGIRHTLNAGHTVAHAIESVSDFKVNHAKSVALGLVIETELAYKLGLISLKRYEFLQDLFKLLPSVDLNEISKDKSKLISAMQSDKKNRNGKITFVLPNEQSVQSVELSIEQINETIEF